MTKHQKGIICIAMSESLTIISHHKPQLPLLKTIGEISARGQQGLCNKLFALRSEEAVSSSVFS